jgi:proteasome lid subunit RPN8/RPN11
MDSAEMFQAVKDIRKQNLRLQVVYHSHPKDPARPSPTDLKIANDWEESWSQLNLTLPMYLLVSLKNASQPDVKTYWIKSGEYTLANVQIT